MRAVMAHSDEVEARDAISEIIDQCRRQLEGDMPKAGVLFMSVDYDHQVALDAIASEWPGLPVIGGTGDGEMSSGAGFRMDSVLLTLLCGDDIEAEFGVGHDLSTDIGRAVDEATGVLEEHASPAVALTMFAPSTNACEVLRQLEERISTPTCPILGGLSGDHREFAKMVEFAGREVLGDSLPVLYLYGNIAASWGVGSGWFPFGEYYRVTSSDGHIVKEIDGKPAIETYVRNYGEVPQGSLGEYPLAVYEGSPEGDFLIRAVMGTDRESGEVRFVGEVKTGSWVRMTQVLPEGILSGSTQSVQQALDRFDGAKPDVGFIFSCAARKWVLGSAAEQEIGLVSKTLSDGPWGEIPVAGFYAFGEIAPVQRGETTNLHNETCIAVLLGHR